MVIEVLIGQNIHDPQYNRDKFPEDLTFKETSNQESFQGR
jgi:hypothetical protein